MLRCQNKLVEIDFNKTYSRFENLAFLKSVKNMEVVETLNQARVQLAFKSKSKLRSRWLALLSYCCFWCKVEHNIFLALLLYDIQLFLENQKKPKKSTLNPLLDCYVTCQKRQSSWAARGRTKREISVGCAHAQYWTSNRCVYVNIDRPLLSAKFNCGCSPLHS